MSYQNFPNVILCFGGFLIALNCICNKTLSVKPENTHTDAFQKKNVMERNINFHNSIKKKRIHTI